MGANAAGLCCAWQKRTSRCDVSRPSRWVRCGGLWRSGPQAFGCRDWFSARASTVAELEAALTHIASHPGAASVEVIIPNQESQPLPDAVIDSGNKLKPPLVS